jgi:hypothetical protein
MGKKFTTIEVTQADIDQAMRKKSGKCVLATAVARSIEGARRVDVDLQTIRFTVDGERRVYLTPPGASGYVIAFDAGDPIHPFGFRLNENHRVSVRQDKATPAAKERIRAKRAISAAEQKQKRAQTRLEATLAQPDPDPVDVAAAKARAKQAANDITKATKNHAETQERLAGEPYIEPDLTPDPGTGERRRKSPKRAYRNSSREYGGRALRVNQDKPTPENIAARDSLMAIYNEGG